MCFRPARIDIGRDLTLINGRLPVDPGGGFRLEVPARQIIQSVGDSPGLIHYNLSPNAAATRLCELGKAAFEQVGSFDLKQGFDRGLTR